jgi:hypothetical protein
MDLIILALPLYVCFSVCVHAFLEWLFRSQQFAGAKTFYIARSFRVSYKLTYTHVYIYVYKLI